MSRAWCLIRPAPHYRREAFAAGLESCGYSVVFDRPVRRAPGEVLIIWNRYADRERLAADWEAAGGTVLVAENGYVGRDEEARQLYALALDGHNGAGRWLAPGARPGGERWAARGITPAPWRAPSRDAHVLICNQRGIGAKELACDPRWADDMVRRVRRHTKRPVRIRRHPALAGPPLPPLEEELEGAWACVVWASTAGIRALVAGVPVFYDAPKWIGAQAARAGVAQLEEPLVDDARRQEMLERLAWAQWTIEELASGEPFRHLLAISGDLLPQARQGEIRAVV